MTDIHENLLLIAGFAAAGVISGVLARRLLGALPRGATVRVGILEASTAILFVTAAGSIGWQPNLSTALWVSALTTTLSAVDIAHHRLPDAITLPAIPVTFAVLLIQDMTGQGFDNTTRALLAAAVIGGMFFLASSFGTSLMGRGDAKLSVTIGAVLGFQSWSAVLVGVFSAFVLGAVFSIIGMLAARLKATSAIPFGPFLLFGAWLTVVFPHLVSV